MSHPHWHFGTWQDYDDNKKLVGWQSRQKLLEARLFHGISAEVWAVVLAGDTKQKTRHQF